MWLTTTAKQLSAEVSHVAAATSRQACRLEGGEQQARRCLLSRRHVKGRGVCRAADGDVENEEVLVVECSVQSVVPVVES